jgi:phosphatidylserine decarboxylase precursor
MHPIVEELQSLITANRWQNAFRLAINSAQATQMPGLDRYRDLDSLLGTLNELVTWVPRVISDPRHAFDTPIQFYFILNQPPLMALQCPIRPGDTATSLTPLSAWMVKFARVFGSYLDTPESAAGIDTFKSLIDWNEYIPPPSGFLTFNQFFARHVRPGRRPIASLNDDSIIVSPADSTFIGQWHINDGLEIAVDEPQLDLKGLKWSIHQLLDGSAYTDRFKGGIFTHSYLSVTDYHRWHSPVQGEVLEARVINGQVYMDVRAKVERVNGKDETVADIVDSTGFQFVQTRGLIILDSPIGLVACLPVGMALVSSVVITAEVGGTLHKGEEIGFFQFGGSDFVMVFQRDANVELVCLPNVHYKQGSHIGNAHTVR